MLLERRSTSVVLRLTGAVQPNSTRQHKYRRRDRTQFVPGAAVLFHVQRGGGAIAGVPQLQWHGFAVDAWWRAVYG